LPSEKITAECGSCEKIEYDLHIHTTASDGMLTPLQVVDQAVKRKLTGIAITDHDTIEGLPAAISYNQTRGYGLDIIPGIELNTEYNEAEVHILGYYIDYTQTALLQYLEHLKAARYHRAEKMVQRLRKMGFMLEFQRVQQIAGSDLIARPHIARALIEKGYVFSVKEAFDKYISKGRPAYVPRYKFKPEKAIELIRQAGGVSVLAHPGLLQSDVLVEKVIHMGIEGIEAYYPEHSSRETRKYLDMAAYRGLLVTGGSDFHGDKIKMKSAAIGDCGINTERIQKIYSYKNRKS